MNSKRSYLDTLNAGRQRRPYATLEQLNRSLETLEQRMDRNRAETQDTSRSALRSSAAFGQGYENDPFRQPQPQAQQRTPERRNAYEQPYQAIARDIERVRGQEDGVAAFGKIAGEIKGLREELRQQMTSGVRREFEALRHDIERSSAAGTAKATSKLSTEFDRLSGAIQSLAEKGDDRGITMLRLEIEQMKQALEPLAREETVQSVDRHWEDFDRRFNAFEDKVAADFRQRPSDPGISTLTKRIEQISDAVNHLPESLSLRSLEEKVRVLAGTLDHFVNQQGSSVTQIVGLIEERLDEISRAIVATTVAAQSTQVDLEPFERIEARISALARQIEEVADDRPSGEVIEHLNVLSERVDTIAARSALPEKAIERLALQISAIADKIDNAPEAPDVRAIFNGIEQRFDVLSGLMERRQGEAIEQGNMLFRELERRLDEVADKIDRAPDDSNLIFSGIEHRFDVLSGMMERRQGDVIEQGNVLFRELERRLDEVSDKIEQRQTDAALDSNGIMSAIDARFSALAQRLETGKPDEDGRAAIRGLEARLEDISERLDQSASQFAGMDRDVIRNLESQVAALSAHLSRPTAALPEFEDIGPRLDEIERSIAGSRESVLDAARQAAENAARSLAGSQAESAAVSGLAQDLKALESLTRRSDERNSKTFEAIHDTLLKIVDRLGSLETDTVAMQPAAIDAPARKMTVQDAPSIEADHPLPLAGSAVAAPRPRTNVERSPAQAAAAAAVDAVNTDRAAEAEQAGRVRSMLGGLGSLLSKKDRKKEPASPEAPTMPRASSDMAPSVDLDAPLDPKLANRPLEPGSGTPDLNAIMKRVRDERGEPVKQSGSAAAQSDFIAAARRAAQAAAAEGEILKRKLDVGSPVKALRIADVLKARRKPILMAAAAIMLALAGLQLGKAFMADKSQVAASEAPVIVARQQLDTADLVGASLPQDDAAPAEVTMAAVLPPVSDASDAASMDDMSPMPNEVEQTNSTTPSAAAVEPVSEAPVAPALPEMAMTEPVDMIVEPAPQVEPAASVSAMLDIPASAGPQALRDAAAAGDPKALFEVASRYAEGRGGKPDMPEAAKWYQKAAELGFAPAEYRIGNFYEKGLGVTRDIAKAKTWYLAAAEKGNASAMHNLAVLDAMGADNVADNQAAARWFEAAAELGVKDSQFNLGIMSAKGIGMPQSLEESYKWFTLVAKTGDKDAADKRDEIAKSLRPEQLEKARATAELWKPKPLDPVANTVDIPDAWRESLDKTAGIDMKKAVQNIQLILNKNGYEAGKPDGVMGGKTKTAIIAFQKDNSLPETGEVDEKLVAELLKRK